MKTATNKILLLLNGMHNTRLIQYNIDDSNKETYDKNTQYKWDELLFELDLSILLEVTTHD